VRRNAVADKPDPRTFTEDELEAITADRVARETAELNEKLETVTKDRDEAQSKLDVEIAAKEAAEQAAAQAKAEHEEFVQKAEAEQAALAKKDERVAKVREAASHLKDEFFEDESRVARIVEMSDEAFEGYLADMRETASGAPSGSSTAPRETAMAGDPVKGETKPAPAAGDFLLRRHLVPSGTEA
jgi:chromosome segregation ATPase